MEAISRLNDDCLIQVFNQFTLQQLLQLQIICKRWQSIIERLCQSKASLQLFGSLEDGHCYWQFAKRNKGGHFAVDTLGEGGNQLILAGSRDEPQLCTVLTRLFPNVKKLVYRCRLDLAPLLENWTLSLEYLALYMFTIEEEQEETIWSHLNALPNLKCLDLFPYRMTLSDQLPTLSRLEHFSLSYFFGDIVSVLIQLSPSIRRLYLDYLPCNLDQLRQFLRVLPAIASGLTHLAVLNIRSNQSTVQDRKHFFQLICKHFVSLTNLEIAFTNQMSLLELIPDLGRLKHLTELKLQISSILPEVSLLPVPMPAPLSSIKTLQLILCKPYDGTHLSNFDIVPALFPNVEEFIIQGNDPDMEPSLGLYLRQFEHLRTYRIL